MTKLCIDCKFHSKAVSDWCDVKTVNLGINLVDGTVRYGGNTRCNNERSIYGDCGPDAKLFQPKKFVVPSNTKLPWWKRIFS